MVKQCLSKAKYMSGSVMSTANALAMEECLQKIADDREVFKEVTEGSAYKNN